jgi:hypothetical protein
MFLDPVNENVERLGVKELPFSVSNATARVGIQTVAGPARGYKKKQCVGAFLCQNRV